MTPREIRELRLRLWAGDFRPVPVYNHDANVVSAGKRPIGDAWQERARRDPPAAVVERPGAIALNTGILCDGLRAVDLDIDDAALAGQVHGLARRMLGPTLVRSRDNSPRVLMLYRASEGSPHKLIVNGRLGKIEVLGRGQQFVAYGRHPSGAALVWRPADPATLGADKLPAVSEAQLTAFLRAAEPLIGVPPRRAPPSRAAGGPVADGGRAALAGLVRMVASASQGERNNLAFWAACRCGEMVAQGLLGAKAAEAVIIQAATRAGLSEIEASRTAQSGIRAGLGGRHG